MKPHPYQDRGSRNAAQLLYPHGKQAKLKKRRIRAMRNMYRAEEDLKELLDIGARA